MISQKGRTTLMTAAAPGRPGSHASPKRTTTARDHMQLADVLGLTVVLGRASVSVPGGDIWGLEHWDTLAATSPWKGVFGSIVAPVIAAQPYACPWSSVGEAQRLRDSRRRAAPMVTLRTR